MRPLLGAARGSYASEPDALRGCSPLLSVGRLRAARAASKKNDKPSSTGELDAGGFRVLRFGALESCMASPDESTSHSDH